MKRFRRVLSILGLLFLVTDLGALSAQPPASTSAPSGRYHARLTPQGENGSLLRVERRDGRLVWQKFCVAPSNVFTSWAPDGDALFVYEIRDGRGRGVDDRISIWRPSGAHVWIRSGMTADGVFEVAWSPDGGRLLVRLAPNFGSLDLNRGTLYKVDLSRGQAYLLAKSVRRAQWLSNDQVRVWEVSEAADSGDDGETVTERDLRVRP